MVGVDVYSDGLFDFQIRWLNDYGMKEYRLNIMF